MKNFSFTDISSDGLIARLPEPVRPYARLMRLDRPIGTWLLLIPCWWGVALSADVLPNLWYMLLFAVGAVIMRGAGCIINDIYDRDIDRLVERTQARPLASGEIALWQAILFLIGLMLSGLGVLFLFNRPTIVVGVLSLALIFTYPLMKRITWWPQLFLGFTFNWGVLMGGTAITGRPDVVHVLAYAAGISWTLAYDTMYAHQDASDDAAIGMKSTALLFGSRSRGWVAGFYALTIAIFGLVGWAAHMGVAYKWGLFVAATFALVQLIMWRPDSPANCLKRFQSNRDLGLILLVTIMLGKLI